MIYTFAELQGLISPIAARYGLKGVYLFGSYARGEAQEDSDIDLLVDTTGTNLKSLFALGALYCDLEEVLHKQVDIVTVSALRQKAQMPSELDFKAMVEKDMVSLYAVA